MKVQTRAQTISDSQLLGWLILTAGRIDSLGRGCSAFTNQTPSPPLNLRLDQCWAFPGIPGSDSSRKLAWPSPPRRLPVTVHALLGWVVNYTPRLVLGLGVITSKLTSRDAPAIENRGRSVSRNPW